MGKLQGFLNPHPLNIVQNLQALAVPFLRADIGTYRDGEDCGIQKSGYAPAVRPIRSWGAMF